MKLKFIIFFTCSLLLFTLTACSNNHDNMDHSNMDHTNSNHNDYSSVKEGLQQAQNPTYAVGSEAIIEAEHLAGMKGSVATIVEAYDTYIYSVTYTPTNGSAKVENHKWVFQGELENAGNQAATVGQQVVLTADHLEGMKGATATIDTVEKTTVYAVDYTPSNGGDVVKNHKWLIESELSPKK